MPRPPRLWAGGIFLQYFSHMAWWHGGFPGGLMVPGTFFAARANAPLSYPWMGSGGTYASTSARCRLGRDSIHNPGIQYKLHQLPLRRPPDLGGRETVPGLQADPVL